MHAFKLYIGSLYTGSSAASIINIFNDSFETVLSFVTELCYVLKVSIYSVGVFYSALTHAEHCRPNTAN